MNTLVRMTDRCHPAFTAFPLRLDDAFAEFMRPLHSLSSEAQALGSISLDISEDADAYRATATLPGVTKDDINISLDGNDLTIAAEIKRDNTAKEGERILHSERYYGKVTRTLRLASEIDEDRIEAKYADGVLSLMLPKKAPASAKKITVS